jgi:hypothetical protein
MPHDHLTANYQAPEANNLRHAIIIAFNKFEDDYPDGTAENIAVKDRSPTYKIGIHARL